MTKYSLLIAVGLLAGVAGAEGIAWDKLTSPIIFRGDKQTAYRDPAAVFHNGWFYAGTAQGERAGRASGENGAHD